MSEQRTGPDSPGWWLWHEERKPARILVVGSAGRFEVASDEEWAEATGREPSEVMGENYWEGTDCSEMPGIWTKEPTP